METRTVNVYKFSELSEKAQARVIATDQECTDWFRSDEYMDSIKALAKHFDADVVDYSFDWGGYGRAEMDFRVPGDDNGGSGEQMNVKEIARRLKTLGDFDPKTLRGNGECVLTGVGTDESAIDGFRLAFMRLGKTDLRELLEGAFESWLKAAQADYAYDYGEGYAETAGANDWRYYADGRFFKENA